MNTNIRNTFEDIEIENKRMQEQIEIVRESINELMLQITYIYEDSIRINEYIKEIKMIEKSEYISEIDETIQEMKND